jgi:ATP-binding cassette, subfamily B, bacterial PglK
MSKELLKELWTLQGARRKLQFYMLLGLMILATFLEVVSLGVIIPFLGVLADPEAIYAMEQLQPLIKFSNINKAEELIFPVTVTFVTIVLFAAVIRLFLLFASIRFSFGVGADLSVNMYRRTLYQDYAVHVSRNSSEIINGIVRKTNTISYGVVTPILTLVTSFFLVFGITIALFFINKEVATIVFFGFGSIYAAIIFFSKKELAKNGEITARESTRVIKSLQEGLGGIRDVLIDNNQEFYCKLYRDSDLPMRKAAGNNQFVSGSPRFIMEAVGMSLIAILAYFMTKTSGVMVAIPLLGALALGAQRLMPALQQAYAGYTTFLGSVPEFRDVMILLRQPLPIIENNKIGKINFNDELRLSNINFRYADGLPNILNNINITIKKSSCTGFIGITGSGKSTLIDLIMMLLFPTSGEMSVDNKIIDESNRILWQANIAHVPQAVYLSDSTIEENIAFGVPKELINKDKVKKAAEGAELSKFIASLKDGYSTKVGERGLMLSGGQRQRIGIARALYKEVSVLILDEATSALDSQTEANIMNTINSLNNELTILIIAHRVTTLKECDQIIDLSDPNNLVIKDYGQIAR